MTDPGDQSKQTLRRKYAVALQTYPTAHMVAVAVASTKRQNQALPRDFEVELGQGHGFDHDTIVDGRWIYTIPKHQFDAGPYLTTLDDAAMERVSEAVAVGLQLL